MKAWQQLIQSQTPNGLTAPSLGGASATPTTANSKSEQTSPSDGQQQSNVSDSRQRRTSISSSSREGTPSQSSTVVGESIAGKSSRPPPTTTAVTGTQLQTNASRTPTPTPSPCLLATPTSSSSSSTLSASQVPPPAPAPQPAAVIPRQTKAQDFARNRIRRMQMLAQVTPQSHKPALPSQTPIPATATTTSSAANEQPKSQEVNKPQQKQQQCQQSGVANSQSLSSQQQAPATGTESFHNTSSVKATGVLPQSDHSSARNSVLNGGHFKAAATSDSNSSLSYSNSSQSSSSNKFTNAHSRSTLSLSQIVTNSFNHDPPPPPPPPPPPFALSSSSAESHFSTPPLSNSASSSTTIARKIGVKGSQESSASSHKHVSETPSPPESLLVRIPRNLVHISRRNHEFREAKGLHYNFGPDRQALPSDLEEFSLTVSIDLTLLHQFSNSQQAISSGLDIEPNRTEWFMKGHRIPESIEPSLRKFDDASEPMETEIITSFGSGGIPQVPTFTSSGHFTAFGGEGIPLLPTSGSQLVPSGASPGVDGCMGNDGYWYSWTDSIPGHDISVTVLPYIYVDDDESDVMEIFTN